VNISKSLKPEPNDASVQVWNLNTSQRAELEELQPKKEDKRGIPVLIEAGYKADGASQIFLGDLRTVNSVKDGADWVTTLESGDGEKAYQTSRIAVSIGPKTPVDTALRAMVKALGVKPGNVETTVQKLKLGKAGKMFSQGVVLSGSVAQQLTQFARSADLEWSIQDGALQFVDRGKALAAKAYRLTPETGLIGSPTVDNKGVLSCQALMLSDIRPGSKVVIESSRVKGNYRIEKIVWRGDTHSQSDWTVDLEGKRY
jgi:hypothetical protein